MRRNSKQAITNYLTTMANKRNNAAVVDTNTTDEEGFENVAQDKKHFDADGFEIVDVGDFKTVVLKEEGDMWKGHILSDIEDNRPDWLPDSFEDKLYLCEDMDGNRTVISKYHKLVKVFEKVGGGRDLVYKITRGKKSGETQNAYVDFDIRIKDLRVKQ